MLCLNRGEIDTGPAWFKAEIDAVAAAVRREQRGEEADRCETGGDETTGWEAKSVLEVEPEKKEGLPGRDTPQKDDLREEQHGHEKDDLREEQHGRETVVKSEGDAPRPPDKLARLPIDVWWGGLDGMVPRNGQGGLASVHQLTAEWLNKSFAAHPREIAFVSHFVEDGDHSDLIMRAQGVGEVYLTVMAQGHSTARAAM